MADNQQQNLDDQGVQAAAGLFNAEQDQEQDVMQPQAEGVIQAQAGLQQLNREQDDRQELFRDAQRNELDPRLRREFRAQNRMQADLEQRFEALMGGMNALLGMNVQQLENQNQLLQGQERAEHDRARIMDQIAAVDLRVMRGFERLGREALSCTDIGFYFQNPLNVFYCIYLLLMLIASAIYYAHRMYVQFSISVMRTVQSTLERIPLGIGAALGFFANSWVLCGFVGVYVLFISIILSNIVDESYRNEYVHSLMMGVLDRLASATHYALDTILRSIFTGEIFSQIRDIHSATFGRLFFILGNGFWTLLRYLYCCASNWWGDECNQWEEYLRQVEEVMTQPTNPELRGGMFGGAGETGSLEEFKEKMNEIKESLDKMNEKMKEKMKEKYGDEMVDETSKLGKELASELLTLDSNKGILPIISLSTRLVSELFKNSINKPLTEKSNKEVKTEYNDKMKGMLSNLRLGLIGNLEIIKSLNDISYEKIDDKLEVKQYDKLLNKMIVKSKFKTDKLSQTLYKLTLYCVDKSRIPDLTFKLTKMFVGDKYSMSHIKSLYSKKHMSLLKSIPDLKSITTVGGSKRISRKKTFRKKNKTKRKSNKRKSNKRKSNKTKKKL